MNDDYLDDDEPKTLQAFRNLLLEGLNVTDMAVVFGVSALEMQRRIAAGGVRPSGKRRNRPIYTVADVAPVIVTPKFDIEKYVKGLKPKDLPPSLQRAFWTAQEARQAFEERAGNLWHTDRVHAAVGRFVMIVRQRLVLATDQVDRMAPLNEEQRGLVQNTFDQIIMELQAGVVDAFKDYAGTGDRQELYENGPTAMLEFDEEEEDDGLGDGMS